MDNEEKIKANIIMLKTDKKVNQQKPILLYFTHNVM